MDLEKIIAYEDEYLLVLDKPAGILVHPTVSENGNTLYDWVKEYYQRHGFAEVPHPVSRLDRFTTGLVIFAKEGIVQGWLDKAGVDKEYLAVTDGMPPSISGIIDAPIARKEGSIIERCVDKNGKRSVTEYQVLKQGEHPLLLLKLLTGRTHQIRVHLAYVGCPVHGDGLYGNGKGQGRHLLHAWRLRFKHPVGGQMLEITRKVPDDMLKFV
ncbi:MAG: RluA family pseudouridine synthase [Acidaminococcaceae bacterium]|nr:RluA family pseudouridine synthase [Acidaminococcaceae bacterium]